MSPQPPKCPLPPRGHPTLPNGAFKWEHRLYSAVRFRQDRGTAGWSRPCRSTATWRRRNAKIGSGSGATSAASDMLSPILARRRLRSAKTRAPPVCLGRIAFPPPVCSVDKSANRSSSLFSGPALFGRRLHSLGLAVRVRTDLPPSPGSRCDTGPRGGRRGLHSFHATAGTR